MILWGPILCPIGPHATGSCLQQCLDGPFGMALFNGATDREAKKVNPKTQLWHIWPSNIYIFYPGILNIRLTCREWANNSKNTKYKCKNPNLDRPPTNIYFYFLDYQELEQMSMIFLSSNTLQIAKCDVLSSFELFSWKYPPFSSLA